MNALICGCPPVARARVAVLGHTAALGGAELALLRLLECVDVENFHVKVILFSDGPLVARLIEAGCDVVVVPLAMRLVTAGRHSAGRSLLASVRTALAVVPFSIRLSRHVRSLRPDLVYATTLKSDLISVPVAWLARRPPLVWHIHDRVSPDYLPPLMVRLIRVLAQHVDHVIVNSRGTASTLQGVSRLSVAYPGFTADQVGPQPSQRQALNPPVVGILGRISPTKGQLEFVRAAARVLERRPDTRFRVVGAALFGEDDYALEVERETQRLGIDQHVEFTGFVDDPVSEIDGLSVCVHASGVPEPFGQVIVEAMIRGVPVVATRAGGATEIVEPEADSEPLGWLVPPNDATALADTIVEVLENPVLARERAHRAWLSACERFPIEKTAEVVSEVWREVAGPATNRP